MVVTNLPDGRRRRTDRERGKGRKRERWEAVRAGGRMAWRGSGAGLIGWRVMADIDDGSLKELGRPWEFSLRAPLVASGVFLFLLLKWGIFSAIVFGYLATCLLAATWGAYRRSW